MSAWSPEHITLPRTENGNMITCNCRNKQKFISAEYCSSEITNIVPETVKRCTNTESVHATQY